MKNITKHTKPAKPQEPTGYPSEKSRWAYMMQAVEPESHAINKAFPGHHPQWVCRSQMRAITPENFTYIRIVMRMTTEQCAAYLRVSTSTILSWEAGRSPVPFMAFELLRVVSESTSFKLSHPEWDGWFISDNGHLVSPDVGNSFSPGELNVMSFQRNDLSWMRGEINRLQNELNAMTASNLKLRQMFLSQGVVEELISMKDRLNALVDSVSTDQVIPFKPSEKVIEGEVA